MRLWTRKDIRTSKDTVLTLSHVGVQVEVEIEDKQFTDDLVWLYLVEDQVDEVIAFLQEWKDAKKTA